nr:MAG TPA: Flagellar and Swarming motility protein [Caudoviricetes sp.]
MFKVHERYNDRETWINADWIWSICQHDKSRDTVIESKHGDVLFVKETVEEINNKIYQERIRFLDLR